MTPLNKYRASVRNGSNSLGPLTPELGPPQMCAPKAVTPAESSQRLTKQNNELPNEPMAPNTHPPVRGCQDNREEPLC